MDEPPEIEEMLTMFKQAAANGRLLFEANKKIAQVLFSSETTPSSRKKILCAVQAPDLIDGPKMEATGATVWTFVTEYRGTDYLIQISARKEYDSFMCTFEVAQTPTPSKTAV